VYQQYPPFGVKSTKTPRFSKSAKPCEWPGPDRTCAPAPRHKAQRVDVRESCM